jgi:hypothetical protein
MDPADELKQVMTGGLVSCALIGKKMVKAIRSKKKVKEVEEPATRPIR